MKKIKKITSHPAVALFIIIGYIIPVILDHSLVEDRTYNLIVGWPAIILSSALALWLGYKRRPERDIKCLDKHIDEAVEKAIEAFPWQEEFSKQLNVAMEDLYKKYDPK